MVFAKIVENQTLDPTIGLLLQIHKHKACIFCRLSPKIRFFIFILLVFAKIIENQTLVPTIGLLLQIHNTNTR
jgi:hypothetical protein